jgi:hypothetical protein
MKKILIAAILVLSASDAMADHETTAAKDQGTYIETAEVVVTSVAGKAFLSGTDQKNLMGFELRAIDAGAVYIGTNSSTQHNVVAGNILTGLPFYSTSSFKVDGKYTGAGYLTAERGISSIRVRIIKFLNQP